MSTTDERDIDPIEEMTRIAQSFLDWPPGGLQRVIALPSLEN